MRPLTTPLNIRRRFWNRVSLATLCGLLLFLLLLPGLLSQVIRYQLPRMGLGTVEIGNIELNLFSGRVVVEELALYKSAARVLYLEKLAVDLSVLSLLEQRLHIESLTVQGLSLTVQQEAGAPLQIAGSALPTAAEDKNAATGDIPSAWRFGIDQLTISDSALLILHPQFSETVQLNSISLGALAMWRPEYVTPLRLRLALREGNIDIKAKSSPFSVEPEHKIELKITSLALANFAALAKPLLSTLQGTLSTEIQLQLQQDTNHKLSFNQQGSLSLNGLNLRYKGEQLTQKSLQWEGKVSLADLSQIESLMVQGDLKLGGISLTEKGNKAASVSLHGLSLSGLQLAGIKQLSLTEVVVDSLVVEAARSKQGVAVVGMPTDKQPAADDVEAVSETEPFNLKLERLVLRGENRFTFDDQSVKPPFRHTLSVTEAEIDHIDTARPQQATTISIKGKDDFYTRFSVEGEIKPFAPHLSLDLKTKVNNFDMPPTSPYLVQLLGYRIATGQLDSDVTMQIENNEMKGEVVLRMNQLKLESEDPARIEEFQSKTTMPLNTALSLLRDSDDNIKLKLPISGKLDDPKFDINDIINTALGKSLKMASVSYLKLLLQPYGSLITVIQLAGKAAGHIQLEPVKFAAGSAELSGEAKPYLEKISKLLEKKSINMQLCGFATMDDLTVMSKGKEKQIPPAGHPALEALAKQRAESIKSLLVKSYAVLPKQLFVCHPELDRSEEATARVEMSI